MIITAEGLSGTVIFDGKIIEVSKHVGGTKFIPLAQLSGLQLHPKTFLGGNAYIEFNIAGASERQHKLHGGIPEMLAQLKSENVVMFTKKQQAKFEQLRDSILTAMRANA